MGTTIAKIIARKIFEIGDELPEFGGKTQRIQFIGGKWPDKEKAMGGLNEEALSIAIARILTESHTK